MNKYQCTDENGDYRDYWELVNENSEFCNEIEHLQQENQELKIQVSSREEVANKYKEVIEEVREVAQQLQLHYQQQPTMIPNVKLNKLLQILDKGESNE